MILPEVIFLSPHAYDRLNARLLRSDDEHGMQGTALGPVLRKPGRRAEIPARRSLRQVILQALRGSVQLDSRRRAAR